MEFEIRHEFRDIKFGDNEFYVTSFFKNFYEKLKKNYPQHNFTINNDKSYEKFGQGGIYSCMNFAMESTSDSILVTGAVVEGEIVEDLLVVFRKEIADLSGWSEMFE